MRSALVAVAAVALFSVCACGREDRAEGDRHHRGGASGAGTAGDGGAPDAGGEGGSGGHAGEIGGNAGAPGGTTTGGTMPGGTSGSGGNTGASGQAGAAGEAGAGGEAAGGEGGGGGSMSGAGGSGGAGMAGAGLAGGGMASQGGNAGVAGQAGNGGAGVGGAGTGGGGIGGVSGGGLGGLAGGGGMGGAGAGGTAGAGNWSDVPLTGDALLPRRGHTATFDETSSLVYVFGGQGYHDLYADLLSFDWRTGRVTHLSTQGAVPSARLNHVAVFDTVRRRLIVFGGRGYYDLFDDVHAVNVDVTPLTWTRLTPTGAAPSPREGHVAIFDAARDRMIVFGGETYYDLDHDTWALEFSAGPNGAWRKLAPTGVPPAPRTEAAVAFDATTSRVFVGGGSGFHDVELDLAVLDLTTADGTWSSQSPAPVTGVSGALVWDELANRLFQQSGQAYYRLLGSPAAPELLDAALVYVESAPAAFLIAGQGYHQLSGRIWRLDL